jgi:hypothetical protein
MAVVKKNLASIIMGVLAVLAVVGVYVWPIPKLYVKLQGELQQSVSMGGEIDSTLHTPRTLPNLSPDTTDSKDLDGFPNDTAINGTQKAIDAFKAQADKMFQAAVKINNDPHTLLVDKELPNPDALTTNLYQKAYGDTTTNYAWLIPILNFTARPTSDQVSAAKDALKAQIDNQLLVHTGTGGDVTEQSRHEADHAYSTQVDLVEGRLDEQAAETHSIYLEDKTLAAIDTKLGQIAAGQAPPPPEKIFDTQLGLWCITDIANAIQRCNAKNCDIDSQTQQPKNDIIHNPIKQIEVIGPPIPTIAGTPTGLVTKQVTASVSARSCNSTYDVVAYTVRLVVDAEKVPLILRELQSGQFLTVLKVQVLQVFDPALTATNDYRYGDKPCVELELQVEELFLHQWTDPLLPDARKQGFGGNANANGQMQIDNGTGDPNAGQGDPTQR